MSRNRTVPCAVDLLKTAKTQMPIVGIGTVVVDQVVELSEFPDVDTKTEVVNSWQQVGGPVPVALSTAAFYGSTTTFCGRWGDDAHGEFIRKTLTGRGIEVVADSPEEDWASGFAQVWVAQATGSRTIAYSRGRFPLLDESVTSKIDLQMPTILHLDGWAADAAIAAARIVNQNGGIVVLDAGSVKPGMDRLLPHVDILIASQLFQQSRFGVDRATDNQLFQLGPTKIITTLGAEGARWLSKDQTLLEPGISVQALDTNGAGDIFAGAVLHAIELGLEPSEMLKFANQVAGFSCGHCGNHTLPSISAAKASE